MNRFHLPRCAAALVLLGLLAGCGGQPAADEDDAPPVANATVNVTTAPPQQRTFHDTIQAWGSAGALHPVTVDLAHAGQVTALDVSVGQSVRRGQRLLVAQPDPAVRSAYQQARSAVTLAQGELDRTRQLAQQRLATQSQLAAARKALADAQAALQAQRKLGGGSAQESVTAPTDGVVSRIDVRLGERFAANAPLLGFTPRSGMLAQLGVQPDDGARLRVGMPVQLQRVYGAGDTLAGTVSMVGQAIDPQTHLLPVLAAIPASAESPAAGSALAATIQTDDYRAWAVPRAAVLHDEHGDYLYVADHGKARRVAVQLRHPDGDPVGVHGPLDAQSQVIVTGVYELHDGDAVHAQAPVSTDTPGQAK